MVTCALCTVSFASGSKRKKGECLVPHTDDEPDIGGGAMIEAGYSRLYEKTFSCCGKEVTCEMEGDPAAYPSAQKRKGLYVPG